MAYVELRCASAFSFLRGASLPEDLVERAAALDYPALALGDRDGLYGAPRFYRAAKEAGLHPIVGADIGLRGGGRLYLLVETREGYKNLCRLITAGQLRSPKGNCESLWEEVEECSRGLLCLVGANASPLSPYLPRPGCSGDLEGACRELGRLASIFQGRTYIEIGRHFDEREERLNRALFVLAEKTKKPLVATNDVRYARRADRPLLDLLTAIRLKTTLDAAGRTLEANSERYLRPKRQMEKLFCDIPSAVSNSAEIASRLSFSLHDLGYRFPDYPLPPGETPDGYLRFLTYAGARERYGAIDARVRRQLEHELSVIAKLNLASYFLIVWDIVQFCRRHGIMAQGRGSAANSAVCYSLGITAVDAVGMNLLFERFLSEERGEWPDIDLDLPSGEGRERVIQYVYHRYGGPHGRGAAMTANVISYRSRSAVREAGKALGFSLAQVDRVAKLLRSHGYQDERDGLEEQLRLGGIDTEAPRVRLLVELAERMRHLPRHLGQHTGGMVIGAGRLDEVVPLEPASMPGRVVVQWDKDDLADLGIIKVDLLGLGMMAVLQEAFPLVKECDGIDLDMAHLPQDDPKVYEMLGRADTIGVFQVESRAQMAILPRMKPKTFYDLVVEVAIVRPGPIVGEMVHPYLNRRAERERVTYPHPCLESILKRTLGVPLFQEQLLRIAMAAAGFSGGEAEELRRAMGMKRSLERMKQIEVKLRAGMATRGITGKAADDIVKSITSFALYGFPESHAASFALIAYASAYLKAHHPQAFYCAMLNNWPLGFYHPATLVKDGQRHGVAFLPIDVSHSRWRCTIEPCGQREKAVRIGLRYVGGLRREAGERIESERKRAPFSDLADFLRRAQLKQNEIDALAHLGAFASFGLRRREALWQAAAIVKDPQSLLAGIKPAATPPAALPPMEPIEETLADYRESGLTTGDHVCAHLREKLSAMGVVKCNELQSFPNGFWLKVAGHVITRQRPGTAKGFFFLTLEDETGTTNAVVTPALFRANRALLVSSSLLTIEGKLQKQDGVIHIRASRFNPIEAGPFLPPSHNFC